MTTEPKRDLSRLMRFPISDMVLHSLFATGNKFAFEVVSGFPADAVFIRRSYDRWTHMYSVTVQSETFAPVKEGQLIPVGHITLRTIPKEELQGGANERQEASSPAAGAVEAEK
jgi:hypothetical protein